MKAEQLRWEVSIVGPAEKSRFTRSGDSWCGFTVAAPRVGCLADLSASDEFGQANGDLRVIDLFGVEGAAVPSGQLGMVLVGRIPHGG